MNHKKRDILFLTITLANLNRFLYHFNHEEILHATMIKFITSPNLYAHLYMHRLSACVDAEGGHFEHYL